MIHEMTDGHVSLPSPLWLYLSEVRHVGSRQLALPEQTMHGTRRV